jgi:hypothetical protein
MPLYEVLLDDWDEIRPSSEPLNVGELVEIEHVDWLVVGVAKRPDHTRRYLCVQQDRGGRQGTRRDEETGPIGLQREDPR